MYLRKRIIENQQRKKKRFKLYSCDDFSVGTYNKAIVDFVKSKRLENQISKELAGIIFTRMFISIERNKGCTNFLADYLFKIGSFMDEDKSPKNPYNIETVSMLK